MRDMQAFGNELFRIKAAGAWVEEAKKKPLPRMVFDRFWLEGELAVLFAEAGKGKSILGVQLAEAIARGESIGEDFRMKLPAQKVLYFDLELSDKQFEMRYSAEVGERIKKGQKIHYEFSEDFLRAQAVSFDDFPKGRFKTYGEYFYDMLRAAINVTEAKVVIIDDLAYLRRGRDRNRDAVRFMRRLRELKEDKGLTVLVIARTPTRSRLNNMVSLADLEGAAEIAGLADNIFAIGGACVDPSLRYIKHIKITSTEAEFDETNVPTFRIEKRDGNFLSFRPVYFEDERYVVRESRHSYDGELMCGIRFQAENGSTQREIADELGISKTTVNRYMAIMALEDEEIERQKQQEELRRLRKQKPLTPAQEYDRRLFEAIKRDHEENLAREAAIAKARGLPPPPPLDLSRCEPMTPSSVFRRYNPEDEKCDCSECLGGRPKNCLEIGRSP